MAQAAVGLQPGLGPHAVPEDHERRDEHGADDEGVEEHPDAVGPKTSLLILGDARSNYSDLHEDVLQELAHTARHSWWLNPEHRRHWGTGDSAAPTYGDIVDMVECRNLTQLGEFVHDLAR